MTDGRGWVLSAQVKHELAPMASKMAHELADSSQMHEERRRDFLTDKKRTADALAKPYAQDLPDYSEFDRIDFPFRKKNFFIFFVL